MRAVVLADQETIDFLNSHFVNVWLLNHDLRLRREEVGVDGLSALERRILTGLSQGSPVDCQVISSDLQRAENLPFNDFLQQSQYRDMPLHYRDFLDRSMETLR